MVAQTSGADAPSPPAYPQHPGPRHRLWIPIAAIAVTAVVVLSGLALAGIIFKPTPLITTTKTKTAPGSVQIANETSILGNNTMSDLTSSGGGFYNFTPGAPGVSSLHSGSLIVSGSGDGLLRRVVSVASSGSGTSVYTVPASLSQVFLNGSLRSAGELDFAGASGGSSHSSAGVPAAGPLFSLSLPFDQVWTTSSGSQLSISGTDVLSANYVLDVNFTLFHGLTGFYFVLQVTNQIQATLSISQTVSFDLTHPIYNKTLDPITFFLGPVPVVLVPVLNFSVGLSVTATASAVTSINSSESLAAGLRFANGTWTPVSSESHNLTYQLPSVSASLDAQAYIDSPHFVLEFYGVVGPSFTLSPYLRLHGVYPGCPSLALYAGLDGTAGIDLGVLSDTSQVLSYRLFNLEWLLGQYPTVCKADVTFHESGLPAGTAWSVSLNGTTLSSTNSSLDFLEPNGTYRFSVGPVAGYTANPPSGSVRLTGTPGSVQIAFAATPPGSYPVTFTESGLPPGVSWTVTTGGTTYRSILSRATFVEENGTYSFIVGSPGYRATPSSGNLTVDGAAVSQTVVFTVASAVGPYIFNSTVANSKDNLSLPSGGQQYLYGFAVGGASNTSEFFRGEYATGVAADGHIASALAMTPSSSNKFTTNDTYYTIGGVGVAGYAYSAEAYGQDVPPVESVTTWNFSFNLSSLALIVVVVVTGGACCLKVTATFNLTVDAIWSGTGGNALEIATAQLSRGSYTITDQTTNNDGGSNTRADLLGVFAYAASPVSITNRAFGAYPAAFAPAPHSSRTLRGGSFNRGYGGRAAVQIALTRPSGAPHGNRAGSAGRYTSGSSSGSMVWGRRIDPISKEMVRVGRRGSLALPPTYGKPISSLSSPPRPAIYRRAMVRR